MPPDPKLRCAPCDVILPVDLTTLTCPGCMRPLSIEYLTHDYHAAADPPMPVAKHFLNAVTLGEGNTPLVELRSIAAQLGLTSLAAKMEYLNPTGSFKDRGAVVLIAAALRYGVREVVEDSSGNAGSSVSAYAARAGMLAHIFAPASTPDAKTRQIEAYGARVHPVDGTREDTTAAAVEYYTERKLVYASHVKSPYFVEGTKSFAYEVFDQSHGEMPQHIVIPVGNGSLLLGVSRGFSELRRGGRVGPIPRLHAVQSIRVMPVVAAFHGRKSGARANRPTVAGGIAIGSPARLDEIVAALKDSDGTAVAVEDREILHWRDALAQQEGIYAEPTSAATFAGLARLVRQGIIRPNERVLAPVTGFGLKDVR